MSLLTHLINQGCEYKRDKYILKKFFLSKNYQIPALPDLNLWFLVLTFNPSSTFAALYFCFSPPVFRISNPLASWGQLERLAVLFSHTESTASVWGHPAGAELYFNTQGWFPSLNTGTAQGGFVQKGAGWMLWTYKIKQKCGCHYAIDTLSTIFLYSPH